MPFHRGCYTKHPTTGVAGLWIALSTDPVGTLTGLALTAFPNVAQADTIATYTAKANTDLRNLCRKVLSGRSTTVVVPSVTFSQIRPTLVIAEVVIDEGDMKSI